MRKCMLIMPVLYTGGAEKQYRYILENINEPNSKVIVLLLNLPSENDYEATKNYIECHKDIEFYQLPGKVYINKNGKNKKRVEKIKALIFQIKWLKRYLKNNKVDVVMFSYVTQLLMVPLLKAYDVKIIFNERNTGRQICDKKYKISLLKKCDRIVANSLFAANYVGRYTNIKVDVIKNGIVSKDVAKVEHQGFNIIVPARISKIKNQMIVVDAMLYLKDLDINFYFAGVVDDDSYYEEIVKRIKEQKLNDRINLCGEIANMDDMYSMMDLLILPSYEEGTPNVLLEAYMYKIPVLASDIPMNRECVIFEEALFAPDNSRELADKIRYAVTGISDEQKENIKNTNYSFVLKNYSMENLRQQYRKLFSI